MAEATTEKPAILRDQQFTVREGLAYRAMRTGAIWMNKLFFSSLILLALWVAYGYAAGTHACVSGVPAAGAAADQGTTQKCSVLLTPTALYLGSVAVLTFLLSIAFGLLGLAVGKQVLVAAPAASEIGAGGSGTMGAEGGGGDGPSGDVPKPGP